MSRHGTLYHYQQGCHCQPCTAANAAYHRDWKQRQCGVPTQVWHGLESTYNNYRCRCRPCRDAHSVYMAAYRQQRRRQEAAR